MNIKRTLLEEFPPAPIDPNEIICVKCIGDVVLKRLMNGRSKEICSVCGSGENFCVDAYFLAKISQDVIRKNFKICTKVPSENNFHLREIVSKVIQIKDERFSQIVASYLETSEGNSKGDQFFCKSYSYSALTLPFKSKRKEQDYLQEQWDAIALSLTHRQRYFNDEAARYFELLFDEAVKTEHKGLFKVALATVTILKAGFIFYRARKVENQADKGEMQKFPDRALGAPPKERAAHNRMNSSGVPLFYAASDRNTSIAEVRPSIGDEVAICQFQSERALKFFDFCGLNMHRSHPLLSYFIDDYAERKDRRNFLAYLHETIAHPVTSEPSRYIVTQAMAEYLRYKHKENFDGIIFKSVQHSGGINYVIFDESRSHKDVTKLNWQPSFAVKAKGKTEIVTISKIQYSGNWI
ncbi:RES family NAD+ phosphorylase [Herbaspirillum sp. NPDC101397]|uniref:RES family NAD+ phosphorylase n=1 Tax=Herbaspirillum sp. NPDC101397 TaxID=3364006 RepID=UPI00383A34BA